MTPHVPAGEQLLPLTRAQSRLWTLAHLRPRDPFFSVPFALDIEGPLDEGALGRSLAELVRRHPALRVRIVRGADGEPVQSVLGAASGTPAMPVAEPVDESEAAVLAAKFAAEPFDVDGGPLLRLRLLRLTGSAAPAHRLLVAVHHIVFDGASLTLFTDELTALYGAFTEGLPSPLPEPAVAYGDFLAARTAHDERDRADNLRYWTARLAGAPLVTELPVRAPRGPAAGHTGDRHTALVPAAVVEPLRALARGKRATLYMVLKAAVDVVLRAYGTTDVLTGMAVSGRDTVESAGLVGYLTRPVVLRADLSDDPEFTTLLTRVRGDLLDALDHADLPVDEVIDALGIPRDPSHHPLYQVMYTHQPASTERRAGGAVFRAGELRLPTTKADLAIDTLETADGGLLAVADYRADLFDTATAGLLLDRLRTVLERVGADPALRVSELLRPDEAQHRALLAAGNPAAGDAPLEECVHALVAAQAARTPDAVAVAAGPRTWRYRELEAAAERQAARLRELGVGPEVRVGVCAPVSFALIAAELAVWKAGGVCVPLPFDLPAFLLRLAVADADLGVVLADPVAAPLFDHTQVAVVEADPDGSASPDGPPVTGAEPDVRPRNAAAVLRTSGATGEPLPVVLEHRQLASRLRWAARELPAGALDFVVPVGAPDAPGAVFELFAPLVRGGRVVIPLGEATGTVYAAPSALDSLADTGAEPGVGPGITPAHVLAAGEPWGPVRLPGVAVHRLYAAAETGGPALAAPAGDGGTSELGAPAGATAYVLDRTGRLAAPGVVGELHIGGAAVARGYLGTPGTTADRFRPDPYGTEPGGRLFATGDLARWTPGGRLEFAGRAVDRTTVAGVRVAAVDVRTALLAHPGVGRAEVVVAAGPPGAPTGPAGSGAPAGADGVLVAAVVARSGTGLGADALRAHLAGILPGHLLPARLEVLDRLPLLPSGRADRAALLDAVAEAAGRRTAHDTARAAERPMSKVERLVAEAWEQVLGRSVGAESGFFDVGGNSLLLVRLRDRLRTALGREIEVIDLFRHSTIRAMAAHFGDSGPDRDTEGAGRTGGDGRDGDGAAPDAGADRGQARQQALRARARARTARAPRTTGTTRTQGGSR
ncbi:condensation domain-containing protein [Streptomyces sp. NPDC046203]|uniref:condensation domain-containing protein n=1 Tax=Streptomyces sp. NPDC046203 TaxID=3154602 RepID=UPI00340FACE9